MPRYTGSRQLRFPLRTFILLLSISHVSERYPIETVSAGPSSTPKNLVNLSAPYEEHDSSFSGQTSASSNQFQNEYQYNRRVSSKPNISERSKQSNTATSELAGSTTNVLENLANDRNNQNELDYSYSDSRVISNVPYCSGRLRLNGTHGFIGDGPGFYPTNLQCIWLIDSGAENATIRIQVHQFNTECNYDFLYLFDGDSVYSPLIAALSGDIKDFSYAFQDTLFPSPISRFTDSDSDMKQSATTIDASIQSKISSSNNSPQTITSLDKNDSKDAHQLQTNESQNPIELKTHSGKAFIYFHSDTALTMPGFYMTYSIDSCPLDCSKRGACNYRTLICTCNSGYFGDGCQYVLCPNNCTSPIHGTCDREKSCICNHNFSGNDCSKRADQQHWNQLLDTNSSVPARAFHQSVILGSKMWIFGGKSQALSNTNTGIYKHKKTPMILSYDLAERKWDNHEEGDENFLGTTGLDHLAELSGHSLAVSGTKVFIYGGIAMNNSILNTLTVFDTKTKQLYSIPNSKTNSRGQDEEFVAPLSVVGHSANIIDGYMYLFWGYNPLFGYLNFAQKFDIANNSWSIVERSGSSVVGCIGHTSTFDPTTRLVYIYGGHNSQRPNKLYSFNPQTEVWTLLQSAPSPRYYHNAIIINGLLTILGGNSYNTSLQSNQCFQPTHLVYDLSCSIINPSNQEHSHPVPCNRKCWHVLEDDGLGVMKRHGHSVNLYNNQELILFGGFNGIILNDLRSLKLQACSNFTSELDCTKPRLGLSCNWNGINSACEEKDSNEFGQLSSNASQCSKSDIKRLQAVCETRETCTDCLYTNLGCTWCGIFAQCQYEKCQTASAKVITKPELCYHDLGGTESTPANISSQLSVLRSSGQLNSEQDNEINCKVDNCYLCQSKPYCSWQNDNCVYSPLSENGQQYPPLPQPSPSQNMATVINDQLISAEATNNSLDSTYDRSLSSDMLISESSNANKPTSAALVSSVIGSSPYHSCDIPCFMRRSCNECTTTKCIWCSTTDQCMDATAYFAYHSTGQCMHYVALSLKCPVSSCSDIDTCEKCLTNPRCGWLNDISNTGKGICTEGTSKGPLAPDSNNSSFTTSVTIKWNGAASAAAVTWNNWYYTSCPSCQCNGHSFCRSNSSSCVRPCQDFTEGAHCDRCISGYYGDPVNGGHCKPCLCNNHAQSCNRETGKCYCSTKGIVGHNCNRCDDKNYYNGDPSTHNNGTCYYNLTTGFQYTFNMSKPEDHFYNQINFVNVPLRRDADADFSIACNRLAFVNISTGTSYKNRRPIQTGLECGSFRIRIPLFAHYHESNYSFYVHVYDFHTPFVLQISFSQNGTFTMPQFFFTFSSCLLFFFAASGLIWKLKHEYDSCIHRQRQFIEMEQMASRPFSTIFLEMFRASDKVEPEKQALKEQPHDETDLAKPAKEHKQNKSVSTTTVAEPTPISFEPCFGGNVGVVSLFVQLPGRPNLAIGSALVSLNEEAATNSVSSAEDEPNDVTRRRSESGKDHVSIKNHRY